MVIHRIQRSPQFVPIYKLEFIDGRYEIEMYATYLLLEDVGWKEEEGCKSGGLYTGGWSPVNTFERRGV